MKKGILIAGVILVAAGAAGAAGWYYFYGSSQTASDENMVYVTKISSLSQTASGVENRYAGVVEPQKTVEVKIDSGRKVSEVQVKTGDEVKQGQLLFQYDLSSIQDDLQQAELDLDRLKNEALSLTDQINTLTAEKQKANANSQLSYSIEIETNKMNLKKNEYNQKSKTAQIEKLKNATTNTEVRSEIDGVIQKIDNSKLSSEDGDTVDDTVSSDSLTSDSSGDSSGAFITILSTGAYRIKGKVNEQNAQSIIEGEPVIVRSRMDESQTWSGVMGAVDRQTTTDSSSSGSSSMFGMMDSSDTQTSSSSYPFYVELDSSDGLMLGQHVYIEKDNGQDEEKEGVWLSDFYIVDADSEDPYVWTAGENQKLEKRSVLLGQHDDNLMEYEIVDGLAEDNCITYPADGLEEGFPTTEADTEQMLSNTISAGDTENLDGAENIDDTIDMEMPDAVMDGGDTGDEIDMDATLEEDTEVFTEEDFTGDDLVPMEEAPGADTSENSEDLE